MIIARRSPLTGDINTMDLDVTQQQLDDYAAGKGLLQNTFPNLPPPEREFIKSGYTPLDWETLFADDLCPVCEDPACEVNSVECGK